MRDTIKIFTPARCLFGSEWPVCKIGRDGGIRDWSNWYGLVELVLALDEASIQEDRERIWWSSAAREYRLPLLDRPVTDLVV